MVELQVRGHGGKRAFFYGDNGESSRMESIPVEWTDLAPEDPFIVLSAGQAYFRVEDLLRLSALIEDLTRTPHGERDGGIVSDDLRRMR